MESFITRIQEFINDEATIMVLNVLVLIMVLLWLLSGGFQFRGRKTPKKKNKR